MTAYKIAWFHHDSPITYTNDERLIINRLIYIMLTKPLNEIRTRAKHFKLYDEATPDDYIRAQDPQPCDTLSFQEHTITKCFNKQGKPKKQKPIHIEYPYGPEEQPIIIDK